LTLSDRGVSLLPILKARRFLGRPVQALRHGAAAASFHRWARARAGDLRRWRL